MTENQITTVLARNKMVRARAGEIPLPKIVGFAFGDGGVDSLGNVIAPEENEVTLRNELLRKSYDAYSMLDETTCRYECMLGEVELQNAEISEIGIYDEEGDLLFIKRFSKKRKDAGLKMTFWIKDVF